MYRAAYGFYGTDDDVPIRLTGYKYWACMYCDDQCRYTTFGAAL